MENNQQNRNQNHEQTQKWDTKDELLLAFAVKRHGVKNWDSVSMELQSKTSLPPSLTTASLCHQKYLDLHIRFSSTDTDYDEEASLPWLEELRQLRVSELKQEVQKYDLSILSLQLKVKILEEEREKSVKEKETKNNNDNNNQTQQQEKPENDNDNKLPRGQIKEIEDPLNSTHEFLDSDRENGSVNESNSTGIEAKTAGATAVTAVDKTETVEEEEEEGGKEESGEVESSARWKKTKGGGESEVRNEEEKKSEPLIGFDLDLIKAHKFGSFFEGRLQSQETEAYKNMIRQHMDLGIIQTRLEQGSYSSASRLALCRDLLLLFNNAIVFYPEGSVEASAAHELRALVCSEIIKETEKSDSTVAPNSNPSKPKAELEKSDSLLAKHKISVPIIVCRKRSSISLAKKNELQQQQEGNDNNVGEDSKTPAVEQGLLSTRSIEKPVTGTRSSRGNKNLKKVTGNSNKKQNISPNVKGSEAVKKLETPNNDKKIETIASGKKRSAADFLKRIKNSPAETVKKISNRRNAGGGEKKDESNNKKAEKQKRVVKKNTNNKKQVKEETGPSRRSSTRPTKKGVEAGAASSKIDENEGNAKDAGKTPRKRARR